MPGVAGRSGGSNIKRPEEKLGNATSAATGADSFDRVDASDYESPTIPSPNPDWDTAARQVWDAVIGSPLADAYAESTDYAFLWITCEAIDAMASNDYRAGQLQAVHAMMRELGMTETQRRQARILIDRTEPETPPAPVLHISRARELHNLE